MLGYKDCPDGVPSMPDYATIDGKHLPITTFLKFDLANPKGTFREIESGFFQIKEPTDCDTSQVIDVPLPYKDTYKSIQMPVLCEIGLLPALCEVEKVLAFGYRGKHADHKWKTKTIEHHDSKAVSHLNRSQCGDLVDDETKCRHRAHSICRLLMSLQHELAG